ncbi:MAG: glycosyltransferase family 4 protein [Burkholderiales bacterium]|nr:glycosyltransferase family 4 protein [Burkholderiales bacterium]
MNAPRERILVVAHGHPDFSLGGGEIAAYRLFKAYQDAPDVEEAFFLARADRGRGACGSIGLRRAGEYLWEQAVHDWHLMKAVHQESLHTWFTDLIRQLRPTIVHVHHYAHLGLEFLRVIKKVDPTIRIHVTLHEYMAICKNNGQMVKTGTNALCSSATFDECQRCFPSLRPEDFWLRKQFFKAHFAVADSFIAPSDFLRRRYIEWGIPASSIVTIENGQDDLPALPPRPLRKGERRNRFAFFGQINPFKGLDLLLRALEALPDEDREQLQVEIHGAHFEHQSTELQDTVRRLLEPLVKARTVRWAGPYRPEQLRQRMAAVDWVLVPSIWWENSPLVIQEAFLCGRPVICADIGGMAEKVRDGIDGLHAPVADPWGWGHTLVRAVEDKTLWDRLVAGIRRPMTHAECAMAHLERFDAVNAAKTRKTGETRSVA